MAAKDEPVVIKKYANRRLYNTGTSTYVTLEDLAGMVKRGEDFTVQDAKTGDDITHPVLTQIIFELENKDGQNMLPILFLRQLISFYGDQMQMIVPSFLEQSMSAFAKEQERFREQMKSALRQDTGRPHEDGAADQGAGGADAAQHGDVPERDADVHALSERRAGCRCARAGEEGDLRQGRRPVGTQEADRRHAAQDRLIEPTVASRSTDSLLFSGLARASEAARRAFSRSKAVNCRGALPSRLVERCQKYRVSQHPSHMFASPMRGILHCGIARPVAGGRSAVLP